MSLKKAYLYLVSVISLVIWVIGAIMLLNMALKATIFQGADKYGHYTYPAAYCQDVGTSTNPSTVKMPECDPGFAEQQRKAEEENRAAQRQRDAAQALSMIVIAAPVWYFHWKQARKEV